ncbi:winged helix-turn-helix transcriptional regulator [Brevibacillus sp. LEMMJ03]|nr:winged helix-turn-helix transcriptional regulator [Brevibacillus sp. LEMMJ03]
MEWAGRTGCRHSQGEDGGGMNVSYLIYLVEDDRVLTSYLQNEGWQVRSAEGEIELTMKEFDLPLLFAKHAGQAFERESILRRIWGDDYDGTDRVVDDLVRRLRKKMPELRLETLYGFGYRMIGS